MKLVINKLNYTDGKKDEVYTDIAVFLNSPSIIYDTYEERD